MMQDHLSGLDVIRINHVESDKISYDDIIDDFVSRKARWIRF